MDEGLEHLAQKKNVQTLTISSEGVSEASIAKIPESLKQLHLVTNRAENPRRLQQTAATNPRCPPQVDGYIGINGGL
jgi:hypothetical protein